MTEMSLDDKIQNNENPSMHYFGNPRHTQSMIEYKIFLEIPVKNCIVGTLLTYPIVFPFIFMAHRIAFDEVLSMK